MHSNKKNRSPYYVIYALAAAVLTITVVVCALRGRITRPEPLPLYGVVMQDGSLLLMGQEYSIGVVSDSCNPEEYMRNTSYHVLTGFDALILQGTDENSKKAIRNIVASRSVEHLLVPKRMDDAFIQELAVISPDTKVTKVLGHDTLIMGDLLLKAHSSGTSLSFVLAHGMDSILCTNTTKKYSKPVSMAILSNVCEDVSWLSSSYTICYGNEEGLVLAAADKEESVKSSLIEFYNDGYGKLVTNGY